MGIQFGTSGWRGLIARDFTFDNVRIATQAIAQYLLSLNPAQKAPAAKTLILGYDTRFLGREFSLAAAEVLASNGLTPLLCNRDTPTPPWLYITSRRTAAGLGRWSAPYRRATRWMPSPKC
jgi:phosphomannomutase